MATQPHNISLSFHWIQHCDSTFGSPLKVMSFFIFLNYANFRSISQPLDCLRRASGNLNERWLMCGWLWDVCVRCSILLCLIWIMSSSLSFVLRQVRHRGLFLVGPTWETCLKLYALLFGRSTFQSFIGFTFPHRTRVRLLAIHHIPHRTSRFPHCFYPLIFLFFFFLFTKSLVSLLYFIGVLSLFIRACLFWIFINWVSIKKWLILK